MTDIQDPGTFGGPDEATGEETSHRLSRRQFIPRAAGGLAVAFGVGGASGYAVGDSRPSAPLPEPTGPTATTIPTAGNPGSGVATFVSRPDLRPAQVTITERTHHQRINDTPRFIVMAPMADITYDSVQRGPMLVDRRGRIVWFQPGPDSTFDVQVQTYKGKRVLTSWHGQLIAGYGAGVGEIIDETYAKVATVGDARALPLDLHEFMLTARGTALATQYETRSADLSSVGGPKQGTMLVCHALEIDVATNTVLHDWVSSDHVGLDESYQPLPGSSATAYDYFHINSIAEAPDGNLLISGRNTWAVYKVHRRTGEIIWRLNGERSDFTVPESAGFSWQHHVRPHGGSHLTMFDNADLSGHGSVGMLLEIDERKRKVALEQAFQHPAKFLSWTLGSFQMRPDGNVFIGWGTQPYFSEFSPDGELLVDGQFDGATRSYRTFLSEWEGRPSDQPAIVARANSAGGFAIYASWNGATEIDHWLVLAGSDPASLQPIGWQPWSGFETTIVVNSHGPLFAVAAIDKQGNELGRSDVT
jgi:hypothetical protein